MYVGNLSFESTENDLQDLFEPHGTVNEVHLMMDRMTGKSRGFAFVTMNDGAQANAAMSALNGRELNGRTLTVNEARPREERPFGGGGGGNFLPHALDELCRGKTVRQGDGVSHGLRPVDDRHRVRHDPRVEGLSPESDRGAALGVTPVRAAPS